MPNEPNEPPEMKLSDDEGVMMLKILRNNPHNHLKRLGIQGEEVVLTFREGIPEPAHIPLDEALSWKDKDWQAFFKENEPLM